jgi:hypothetical protein
VMELDEREVIVAASRRVLTLTFVSLAALIAAVVGVITVGRVGGGLSGRPDYTRCSSSAPDGRTAFQPRWRIFGEARPRYACVHSLTRPTQP